MWNISLGEISYPKDRNLMFHLLNRAGPPNAGPDDPRGAASRTAKVVREIEPPPRAGPARDGWRVGWHPALDAKWGAPPHETTHAHTLADAAPTRWSSYPAATRGVFH